MNCFEVSTKGFLNTRNHSALNTLHKFVKQNITRSHFKSNISALSNPKKQTARSVDNAGDDLYDGFNEAGILGE